MFKRRDLKIIDWFTILTKVLLPCEMNFLYLSQNLFINKTWNLEKLTVCNKGREVDTPIGIPRPCSSSEDELTGYSKVVVSANLADEILDEIYGKIENPKYENAVVSENGAIEAPLHRNNNNSEQSPQASKSLADEILDELYGPKTTTTSALETENSYEEIGKSRNLERHDPVINGKITFNYYGYYMIMIIRVL
jgi:hypothetical protein